MATTLVLLSALIVIPRLGILYEPGHDKLAHDDLDEIIRMDDEIQRDLHSRHPGHVHEVSPALRAVYARRDRVADEIRVLDHGAEARRELPRLTGTLITSTSRIASVQLPDGSVTHVGEGDTVCDQIVKSIYQRHLVLEMAHIDITLELSASNAMPRALRRPAAEPDVAGVEDLISANMQTARDRLLVPTGWRPKIARKTDPRSTDHRYQILTVGLSN